MHKYSEFRGEMRRRKYIHHYTRIMRGIMYGATVAAIVAGGWLFTVMYMLTFVN